MNKWDSMMMNGTRFDYFIKTKGI